MIRRILAAATLLIAMATGINTVSIHAAYAQSTTCAAGVGTGVLVIGGYVIEVPCSGSAPTGTYIPVYNNASGIWSTAGLLAIGGIPSYATQCGSTVNPTGIIPPTSGDDADVIQAAVNACTNFEHVQLGAGSTFSAVVSISGNALTVNSTTNTIAVGQAILGANLYPGTNVVTISGSTGTVSLPPVYGQTVSGESVTIANQFNFATNEYVLISTPIKVVGSGTCNVGNIFQAVCPTIINEYEGSLPDWTTIGSSAICGTISTSPSACSQSQSPFVLSAGGTYTPGWGGCSIDNVNPTTSNCGTTLTADAAQGATTVSVTSTSHFTTNMWVLIDEDPQVTAIADPLCPTGNGGQCSTTVSATSDWQSSSATSATNRQAGGDEPGFYSFIGTGTSNRTNQEIHQIASIGTNTLTFTEPLMLAFRQSGSHDARVYWPTISGTVTNFLDQAGLENLSITRPTQNNGGVTVEFCSHCWIKGVEVGGWVQGAVNINNSANDQLEGNYFHLGYNLINNGNEYPIGISERSTGNLVENNIDVYGGKGMVGRAASGNVIAYNYVDKTFYESVCTSPTACTIGDYFQEFAANGSHYVGSHHWLFEGNWTYNCDADQTHGSASYHFYFRNWCTGLRSNLTDYSVNLAVSDTSGIGYAPTYPYPGVRSVSPGLLRTAGPMGWNYWFAFAGNVLGTAGQTTSGNGWAYQIKAEFGPGQSNNGIWASGWAAGGDQNSDPSLDGVNGTQYIFKNGNFDYVSNAVIDNAAGYSQSFPNSFYLPSSGATAPSFFTAGTCTYPWPWVTANTSPYIHTNSCGGSGLPAKARYDAGTPFVPP
jgi:hypothetical protein